MQRPRGGRVSGSPPPRARRPIAAGPRARRPRTRRLGARPGPPNTGAGAARAPSRSPVASRSAAEMELMNGENLQAMTVILMSA